MKKLFYVLLFSPLTLFAIGENFWGVRNTSNTVNGDSTFRRLDGSNLGDVLHSVIVGDCATTDGVFSIYDSSAQVSNLVATVSVSSSSNDAKGCRHQYEFGVRISSGISYTLSVPANVTILWTDFNPGDD